MEYNLLIFTKLYLPLYFSPKLLPNQLNYTSFKTFFFYINYIFLSYVKELYIKF